MSSIARKYNLFGTDEPAKYESDFTPITKLIKKGEERARFFDFLSTGRLSILAVRCGNFPGDPIIIINKKTNELVWLDHGEIRLRTKVATGKTNDLTPEGIFTVTVKAVNPYYRKRNIPGGDPRNPLGSRWIGFDARGTDGRIYGLHGTNQPHSIGEYVSEGCIRLPKRSLESLYEHVSSGTKILITYSDKSFEQLASEAGAQ